MNDRLSDAGAAALLAPPRVWELWQAPSTAGRAWELIGVFQSRAAADRAAAQLSRAFCVLPLTDPRLAHAAPEERP